MPRSSDWQLAHTSYTMLSTWLTCREKFRFKYSERISEKPGIWFPQGNTIHACVYDFHMNTDIEIDELIDMAHGYYDEHIAGKEFWDFKGHRLTAAEIEEQRESTIRWLRGYVAGVKDGTFPFIKFSKPPEQDIERPVDNTNMIARGTVDFFAESVSVLPTGEILMKSDDGSIHIGDFKTGNAKKMYGWNQVKADIDLQPTVYGYIMGKPLTFHYIVIEKTASHEKPSLKHIVTYRDEHDYAAFERIMATFEMETDRLNGYENGIFYPEPVMGYGKFCNKLCGYKDICWNHNYDRENRPIELETES